MLVSSVDYRILKGVRWRSSSNIGLHFDDVDLHKCIEFSSSKLTATGYNLRALLVYLIYVQHKLSMLHQGATSSQILCLILISANGSSDMMM